MEFYKNNNIADTGPRGRTGFLNIPLASLMSVNNSDIAPLARNNELVHHDIPITSLYESDATNLVGLLGPRLITVDVPLESIRESSSNDIPAVTDTPSGSDPDGFGGLLATDTTPALEYVNGDTDSQLRLLWASSNSDVIVFQFGLPANLDTARDMTLYFRGVMGGSTDTPTLATDVYFNEGDTKVEDTSTAFGSSVANESVTIAAADIPSGARTVTVEVTPGAHTTDTLAIYAVWAEFYTTTTPSLDLVNGDTDSQLGIVWAASDSTALTFQTSLPRTLDASHDMTLYVRGVMSGSTDTPTIALDTYFNEGDTKVEDATSALGSSVANDSATIAAADIPAGAQTVTIELTPGAHTTDTLTVYAVWLEYYVSGDTIGPELTFTNPGSDDSFMLRWDASENTPVAFHTVLPPDFDPNDPLYVKLWADMGGSTDTPTFSLDTFFNKADTEVADTTEALSDTEGEFVATIAAADIPAAARVMTCELTPGAHTTDTIDLMGIWLEYTRLP